MELSLEVVDAAVGCTMLSLSGMPTDGCWLELSLEKVDDAVELGAVGCTSLLGPGLEDGCCPKRLPDRRPDEL